MNPNKVWLVMLRHEDADDEMPHVAFASEEEAREFVGRRAVPPYFRVTSVQLCGKGFGEDDQ